MADVSSYVLVGGRKYRFSDEQEEVHSDGEWSLHRYNGHVEGWTNYKLYRDAKARKRVWYIGIHHANGLNQNIEMDKLDKYHPKMKEWVLSAIDGVVVPLPEPLEPRKLGEAGVTKELVEMAVQRLRRAWEDGVPWSPYAQTRSSGRYAVDLLAEQFDVSPETAKEVVAYIIQSEMATVEMLDTKTKIKGLRVF